MEAALMSVATAVLKPLLQKLSALLDEKYKRFKGVRKGIESLRHELTAMESFLLKMYEEEDPDIQDKVWMNEMRDLSYDMEDAIDDFMRSVDDEDAKPDSFTDKVKHWTLKLRNLKRRQKIGNEIHDLKNLIIEAGERNRRYKCHEVFSSTNNAIVDPRALSIFQDAAALVGMSEPRAEVIRLLSEGASTKQQPTLVAIVGAGGMGKTTLAYQVYHHLKGKFDCWTFLSISRNPDMLNILRTILSEVTGQPYATTEAASVQQLLFKIKDFLVDKRFIAVVDDVWDIETWDVIKLTFPNSTSSSMIITTTRISDVAESCRASFNGYIYGIRRLSEVHSRELFHRRLFDSNGNWPAHIEDISDQILRKCEGMPLAIITISGMLANKERTESLWNQVNNSIGCGLERNREVEKMMQILSLSYFDLPPHLKSCLLYLSIFPEDFIFSKKVTIWRWVGEGFIQEEGKYTLYEIGERCFHELVNRSLIIPCETTKDGKVKSGRIHDIIHDFLISKSAQENFVTIVGPRMKTFGAENKVVRRLSLQANHGWNEPIPSGLELSHTRSLIVFSDTSFGLSRLWDVKVSSSKQFRYLRILDLMHYCGSDALLSENLAKLVHLRYLNLNGSKVQKLPEKIGRFGSLQMLDIRTTDIQELPSSIVNLRRLVELLLHQAVKFPDGIEKMQALETLKGVMASKQSYEFLQNFGELKNLRNLSLHVYESGHFIADECIKAMAASLSKLGNLQSLVILEGRSLLQQPLCLATTLKKLVARFSPMPQVLTWLSSLINLQCLELEVEGIKQTDLCFLGALPSLQFLYLMSSKLSEDLGINAKTGFASLRLFYFDARFLDKELVFEEGSMPKLENLYLNFIRLVEAECMDFGIKNLSCLVTVKCQALGGFKVYEAIETAMRIATSTHPNHPVLEFIGAGSRSSA